MGGIGTSGKVQGLSLFFYYEGYSIKEIAQLLGMPENTVKTNLKRGREALKKGWQIEGMENEYECKWNWKTALF